MHNRCALLAAWCQSDIARAVLPADRGAVEGSMSVRELILELLATNGSYDELYDACAVLGRLLAQQGATPTLASATVNHLAHALDTPSAQWVIPAGAALAEGFASSLAEAARSDAMFAWEFPSCAVPLGQAALAIAAGRASEDDEALAAWAARVAKKAALRGVRRVVVSGGERQWAALADALTLVGIEVQRAEWR